MRHSPQVSVQTQQRGMHTRTCRSCLMLHCFYVHPCGSRTAGQHRRQTAATPIWEGQRHSPQNSHINAQRVSPAIGSCQSGNILNCSAASNKRKIAMTLTTNCLEGLEGEDCHCTHLLYGRERYNHRSKSTKACTLKAGASAVGRMRSKGSGQGAWCRPLPDSAAGCALCGPERRSLGSSLAGTP